MAEVIKKKLKKRVKQIDKQSSVKKTCTLPTEKHIPSQRFEDYVKIIYGGYGVGKTTLALEQPNSYAMMFDPNRSYECYQSLISTWQDFLELQSALLLEDHSFENIIIDGLQIAYEMSSDYRCKQLGIDHPGDMNDFGATWNRVKKAFIVPIRELVNSGIGVTFVCHAAEIETETASGRKFVTMSPDLSKQALQTIVKPWDNVFYYHHTENGKRFLQIVGDEYIEAKNRMKGHFVSLDGQPIFKIPMGNNEKEAYSNLLKAFNNKQEKSFQPVKVDKPERSRKKLKKLVKKV